MSPAFDISESKLDLFLKPWHDFLGWVCIFQLEFGHSAVKRKKEDKVPFSIFINNVDEAIQ